MRSLDLVRDYFNREAARFDAIYDQRKPWTQRIVDRLFRGVVVERFRLICNLAPGSDAWSVLDVGCGSGRYAIALARAGARRCGCGDGDD
jgi:ubiquinone/menaquinone biosynthesis C-methylase UbiE